MQLDFVGGTSHGSLDKLMVHSIVPVQRITARACEVMEVYNSLESLYGLVEW